QVLSHEAGKSTRPPMTPRQEIRTAPWRPMMSAAEQDRQAERRRSRGLMVLSSLPRDCSPESRSRLSPRFAGPFIQWPAPTAPPYTRQSDDRHRWPQLPNRRKERAHELEKMGVGRRGRTVVMALISRAP